MKSFFIRNRWLNGIYLLINLSVAITTVSAQTTVTNDIPITLEITNTAINRVVAHQWAHLPQKRWSGSHNGLSYNITLNRPSVVLEPNKIVTQLSLSISSSANGLTVYNGTLAISPELVIPANTIDLGNIVTQYVNLRQSIDQLSVLIGVNDSRLNQVIENVLSPIDWIMYTGNAIEQSQVRWSDEADIRWSELPDLNYKVVDGKINVTVIPKVTSNIPKYIFGIEYKLKDSNGYFNWDVITYSTVKIETEHIRLLDVAGSGVNMVPPFENNQSVNFEFKGITYNYKSSARLVVGHEFYIASSILYHVKRGAFEKIWNIKGAFVFHRSNQVVYKAYTE